MLARVLKTISRYNMLPEGCRVIVAVSGGADSVCLLHVLRELAPAAVAGVAHFNHKWRAEASDEDEQFVADLSSRLELPFFRSEATPSHGNLEQEARRARQSFFAQIQTLSTHSQPAHPPNPTQPLPPTQPPQPSPDCKGGDAGPAIIALGHTRDDQAETVLFRILRGSGLAGLAGIHPVAPGIIRPLLDVTRKEVEQYLRSRNIPWREDSTNQDLSFARNRIRHDLLPQLTRDWNPQLTEALARLADLAHEEEKYWHTVGQVPDLSPATELPINTLALPRAVARRLIRRAIAQAKGDLRGIDFDHVEAVLDLQRTLHLPGVTVTRSFDWLRFAPSSTPKPTSSQEITAPGTYPSPDGQSRICVDFTQIGPEPPRNSCATLKVEACWFQSCSPLVLRGWRPGDHYRPAGQSRDHKIQEMFQKARVPSWRRASWPILTSGDKILWARQFGVAEEFAVPRDDRTLFRIRELI
jgi:tRNA(Ile)-lysidine synthase